jgi:hypothetical protein
VICTGVSAVTAAALAVKLACVAPAATVTEAGTGRRLVLLLDSATAAALLGAGVMVTVHCVEAGGVSSAGVQATASWV